MKLGRRLKGESRRVPITIHAPINILNAIIFVGGIVAAVFIVVGGFNYMTSAGDASKVAKAKNTIIYALIGLVVCVLAFAIVNWAIGTLNKAA